MKEMHRLIVTSDTYKLASEADPAVMAANIKADPQDTYLWHFRAAAAGSRAGLGFDPRPRPAIST